MKAVVILLFVFFLTEIVQATKDYSFVNNCILLISESNTTSVNDSINTDLSISETLIETQENNDNKTITMWLLNNSLQTSKQEIIWLKSKTTNRFRKNILSFYTNLPPPVSGINHNRYA